MEAFVAIPLCYKHFILSFQVISAHLLFWGWLQNCPPWWYFIEPKMSMRHLVQSRKFAQSHQYRPLTYRNFNISTIAITHIWRFFWWNLQICWKHFGAPHILIFLFHEEKNTCNEVYKFAIKILVFCFIAQRKTTDKRKMFVL